MSILSLSSHHWLEQINIWHWKFISTQFLHKWNTCRRVSQICRTQVFSNIQIDSTLLLLLLLLWLILLLLLPWLFRLLLFLLRLLLLLLLLRLLLLLLILLKYLHILRLLCGNSWNCYLFVLDLVIVHLLDGNFSIFSLLILDECKSLACICYLVSVHIYKLNFSEWAEQISQLIISYVFKWVN